MYGIGTVARLAQVSVRTLRHYDELGLLIPAAVDARTGYRSYAPEQLHRLHRILALRDLGLPLAEVRDLLDDDVTVEQLRGILRLRQRQARARLESQEQQLARVAARLAHLEEVGMHGYDITVKRLDPVRAVVLAEDLRDHGEIDEAAARLYPRLHAALRGAGVAFTGVSYALYEELAGSDRPIRLTVGLPVPDDVTLDADGVATVVVPAVARAATTVVTGPPARFHDAFRALHDWVARTGERATGHEREVYVDCDGPRESWVTELQVVLAADA